MTRDQVNEIAQGRVWAGLDAKRIGLVDQLGSFDDAIKSAARRAKLTDYDVDFIEPELSWAQELLLSTKTRAVKAVFKVIGPDKDTQSLVDMANRFDPLKKELAHISRFTTPNRVYAYCFCGND